ncbi:MAG: 16S rRNA (cytosine(967)-C(5))-methyltransferase RsmB [Pseudohongiella sp.]|nr:16S rRNA (cytosine(967)-C(5))-methyltransferase RsmB [Pseudohongiella sp.]
MKAISLNQPAGVRANAALILSKLLQQQGSLATQLPRSSDGTDASALSLLKELCYGSCRWYFQLDNALAGLLSKPLKAKDLDIRCLLVVGLYQLAHLRTPDYVSINETVNAVALLKKPWAKALVNGVLRQFQRQLSTGTLEYKTDAAQFSHPQWLIDLLKTAWPEQWPMILEAGNRHPPMSLRVNRQQISRSDYVQALHEAGMGAVTGVYASSAVYLEKPCPVDDLPGFFQGWVSVQDEASQLLPDLLKPAAGQRILDACAAPGGKTCHILETEPEPAEVVALDIELRRLERLHENLHRLALDSERVAVVGADATQTHSWWDGRSFDRVLLDAPCSATGIIRRQPDIKLLRQPTDITRLTELQSRLLDSLWTCLKPGGVMVYSTCSILPAENTEQISAFLTRTPDAVAIPITADWGIACEQGRQILPTDHGPDGFYFACLQKQG